METGRLDELNGLFLPDGQSNILENASNEGSWEHHRDHHIKPEMEATSNFRVNITDETETRYRTRLAHYTVLGLTDTAKAVDALPSIRTDGDEAERATGTTDAHARDEGDSDPQPYPRQLARESRRFEASRRENLRATGAVQHKAGERTRTVNIQLGRLTLYQLSYAR